MEVYNFVLADTVENRVKDVLEEKLSVILKEIGIDKYADVLDSETAGVNFTDAYMSAIRSPKNIEFSIRPVEEDLKTQAKNTLRIKDLIREDKDLTTLVGADTSFDIDTALRSMMAWYESSAGNPVLPLDTYSINDERIIKHLRKEIHQDAQANLLHVNIQEFTGEKGWFMLWHLSVAANGTGGKTIPVFINDDGILRPLAGKRIWNALLDETRVITASEGSPADATRFEELKEASQEYAFDMFQEMCAEHERRVEENHTKYSYALSLRFEAAGRIGIENIRNHKLRSLTQEREEMEAQYRLDKQLCPDFHLELLIRME